MARSTLALVCLGALAACAPLTVQQGGPALISGQTPAAANSYNSEPQPPNSLPPGAEGMGTGPNARVPSYGSLTFRSPSL